MKLAKIGGAMKRPWWIVPIALVVLVVVWIIVAPHSPFDGKWKDRNGGNVWEFSGTSITMYDENGLILRFGQFIYSPNRLSVTSHQADHKGDDVSVTYIYKLDKNHLTFSEPVVFDFIKLP